MELKNQFRVSVPIDAAWAVLTDLERVAPCMPGAELQQVEGDEYRGIVKVKVGPVTAQYKGTARFVEKSDAEHRAVLQAQGRETRGQGNASAMVTATAEPDGDGTVVSIVTELAITGKVAQFGRSIMGDVSTKLLGEFADRLEADLLSQGSSPEVPRPVSEEARSTAVPASDGHEPSAVRQIRSAPAEPVDLLGTAGPSVLKRVVPLALVLSLALFVWMRRRRCRAT
ncbi:MAG: SRPBCC family protein [Acidimicrobiales bacterium]